MTLNLGNRDAHAWFECTKAAQVTGNYFARFIDGTSKLELRGNGVTTAEIKVEETILTIPKAKIAASRNFVAIANGSRGLKAVQSGENVIINSGTVIPNASSISFDCIELLLEQ